MTAEFRRGIGSYVSGDIADVLRIGQNEFEVPLQQMPHRFPVHPRRLHRHMSHPMHAQELVQLEQCRRGRRKSLHFIVRQQFGVLAGSPVQRANGLKAPRENRPRSRRTSILTQNRSAETTALMLHVSGSARSATEN